MRQMNDLGAPTNGVTLAVLNIEEDDSVIALGCDPCASHSKSDQLHHVWVCNRVRQMQISRVSMMS